MALSTAQEQRLYFLIRDAFPNDTPEALGLRILRVALNNSPSNAQKTVLQSFIANAVGSLNARLATYDADAAAQKTLVTAERDAVNAMVV